MILEKAYFKKIDIDKFINECYFRLQGSAIFTQNESVVSELVSWASQKKCKTSHSEFVPSHIGSIYRDFDKNGNIDIYILDIKPPKATRQKLSTYLKYTEDNYILITRDFIIDVEQFNAYMRERVGLFYGLLSAVQCIFRKFTLKYGMHCSENHIYAYNQQNKMWDIKANKATPDDLMHYLINHQAECEYRN